VEIVGDARERQAGRQAGMVALLSTTTTTTTTTMLRKGAI